jgi:protein TonB
MFLNRKKNPKYDIKQDYTKNFELALAVSIFINALTFTIFPKFEEYVDREKERKQDIYSILKLEDIPITKQPTKLPPPKKPQIPIPVESENIPEDVTIETTELDFSRPTIETGVGSLFETEVEPYPYHASMRFAPDSLKRIKGVVKLAVKVDATGKIVNIEVVSNTTKNSVLEKIAIEEVSKWKFFPARRGDTPIEGVYFYPYKFGE